MIRIAAFALHGTLSMKGVCTMLAKEFNRNRKLCTVVLAPFSCLSLPSLPRPPHHIDSVPSGWYLVAALGPVAVDVLLKTQRGGQW